MSKHRDAVNMQQAAKVTKLAGTLWNCGIRWKQETRGAFDSRNWLRLNLTIGSLSERGQAWICVPNSYEKAGELLADRLSGGNCRD